MGGRSVDQIAAEAAALAAGTHKPAVDDFGNQYLTPVAGHGGHRPCNCRCAYMPCRHRRKEHDREDGSCRLCGCRGFL